MKNLKRSILAFAMITGLFSAGYANSDTNIEPAKSISSQVQDLLAKPALENEAPLTAAINFYVNSMGEIVVLDVKSESLYIKNLVKSRLNYKKLSDDVTTNSKYLINVTFKKGA